MGVTSSGLLDEERDASAASMSQREVDSPDNTLVASGERNLAASVVIGRPVAGSLNVCWAGPCIYTLEGTVNLSTTTTTSTTVTTTTSTTTTTTTTTTT